MNSHKIDQIFSNKLEDYQVKPPAEAWTSIQQEINGSDSGKFSIWKIAASLAIIFISSFAVYTFMNSSKTEIQTEEAEPISQEKPAAPSNASENPQTVNTSGEVPSQSDTDNRIIYRELKLVQPVYPDYSAITINSTDVVRKVNYNPVALEIPTEDNPEPLPPVTLSFRSGNKMLNEDATSEPEKESTLRKAWDYALSVKNGEERPFNIKEMKNELFASNFKRKKSKTQDYEK